MKVTPIKEPTLEQRIAAALESTDHIAASYFVDLIRETDEQIDHCDQKSRECRAASIDPVRMDGIAQRGAAEDAEFVAHRLRAGLERLKECHRIADARETLQAWHKQADALEARRDALAAEFAERYPLLTGWLPDVLRRMAALDKEIENLGLMVPGHKAGGWSPLSWPRAASTAGACPSRSRSN